MSSPKGTTIIQFLQFTVGAKSQSNYIYFILLSGPTKSGQEDLKQARRRLSVMSDNKLVEGFDNVNLDAEEEVKYKMLMWLMFDYGILQYPVKLSLLQLLPLFNLNEFKLFIDLYLFPL
jgi:hypothetical protein